MVTMRLQAEIHPTQNYLICEPIKEETTLGGLHLPLSLQKEGITGLKKCRVIRAGPGKRHEHTGEFIKTEIRVGQVIAQLGNVMRFEENGKELWLVPEEMVFGYELETHMED